MRLSLYFLFALSFIKVTAQQKLFESYVGWNGNAATLKTLQNKTQACTFILLTDSVKTFLIERKKQQQQIFTVPRAMSEKFLGGFIKAGKVYLFMDNGTGSGIRCWLYDIAGKKLTENPIAFEIKNSRIINRLSSDNYFFYFTYNKKTTEFVIYKFGDEKKCDTISYRDNEGLWESVTKDQLFSREIDIERADMEGECDIETAESANKIYVRNDTLLLIINGSERFTSVYSFDLAKGDISSRNIRHVAAHDYPVPNVYNSFLLEDKLYFCSASRGALNLQVLDFYTGKLINEFYVKNGEDISFLNTSIGEKLTDDVKAAAGKTGKLLKEMSKGSVVIIAQPLHKDSAVVLTIASFRVLQQGGGMMMGPNGQMTGFSPGYSWNQSTRFKTMLSSKSYEHIPGIMPLLINERTDEYIKDMKVNKNGQQLFSLNDEYYFAFYNKKERTLNVVTFEK